MKNLYPILFIGLFMASCGGITKEQLKGKWTAVQLTEEGDSLSVNLDEITLNFRDKSYDFTSTLNYKESGAYSLNKNLLSTTDSLNQGTQAKVVEITKLANDSLFIRMNEGGKERILVMTR